MVIAVRLTKSNNLFASYYRGVAIVKQIILFSQYSRHGWRKKAQLILNVIRIFLDLEMLKAGLKRSVSC